MRRVLLSALLSSAGAAIAADSLVPTDLRYVGDCVSPRILAPTNGVQSRMDRDYCVSGNLGNPEKIQNCLRNVASRKEVTFFWDTCGSEEGPFQISLGGKEYTLRKVKRLDARNVPVAGIYEAQGLRVVIEPGRLLRRSQLSLEDGGDEEYAVLVTAQQGSSVNRIHGVFWHGH
jgi:hypothetical protein